VWWLELEFEVEVVHQLCVQFQGKDIGAYNLSQRTVYFFEG